MDDVLPVESEDVLTAMDLVLEQEGASARDAIHMGVMRRYGIPRILSFDAGFNRFEGVERISE